MKELAGEHCRVGRVEVSGKGVMTHGTGRGGKRERERKGDWLSAHLAGSSYET